MAIYLEILTSHLSLAPEFIPVVRGKGYTPPKTTRFNGFQADQGVSEALLPSPPVQFPAPAEFSAYPI